MTWIELFLGFLVANLLGYGGGPSSIPLMQDEAVNHYGWLTNDEFVHALAIGNALPGPIATKIAAFVGYHAGGLPGAIAALLGTVVPSSVAVIGLLRLLNRYRQSSVVKGMTLLVQPVIAVLLAVLTWQTGVSSLDEIGWAHFFGLTLMALYAMRKLNVHPVLIIAASFVYGAVFLS